MLDMDDRRIFERMITKLPMHFLETDSGKEGTGQLIDFSANGMGVITLKALYKRMALEMWLKMPDSHEPFYTRGEVVWSRLLEGSSLRRVGIRLKKNEFMNFSRILRMSPVLKP